jgi:hypothetical protein
MQLRFFAAVPLLTLVACGNAFTSAPSDAGDQGDATTLEDGGVTGDGGDGSTTPHFCASLQTHHFLCDDFDEGNDVKAGWDTEAVGPAADLAYDTAESTSPSRSLMVRTTHAFLAQEEDALLGKDIGNNVQSMTLSFNMYPDQFGGEDGGTSDRDFALLAIWSMGPLTYTLGFGLAPQLVFGEQLATDAGPPPRMARVAGSTLTPGKWHHVDVVLTLPKAAASGHISIKVDSTTQLDSDLSLTAPPGDLQFAMGLVVLNTAFAWRIHYDDVIIDKQ